MRAMPNDDKYEKVFFQLHKDEDDYPPDDWETLWAYEVEDGLYSLDNVPFFARGVSWGDVVSVALNGDELHFKEVIRPSAHSVLRVIVHNHSDVDEVHESLQRMNCNTEQSHIPSLLAVDVPPSVNLKEVRAFLDNGEEEGRWEYETASIRQA